VVAVLFRRRRDQHRAGTHAALRVGPVRLVPQPSRRFCIQPNKETVFLSFSLKISAFSASLRFILIFKETS
jgi:hypothetical protein